MFDQPNKFSGNYARFAPDVKRVRTFFDFRALGSTKMSEFLKKLIFET